MWLHVRRRPPRRTSHLGMRLLGIGSDAEVHIERVGSIAELEQNVPERQTVLPAGHRHENSVFFPEHLLRLDRPRDLIVDEAVEAAFAEGGIVARKADHRFGFAFGAIHVEQLRVMVGGYVSRRFLLGLRLNLGLAFHRKSPVGFRSDLRRRAFRLR